MGKFFIIAAIWALFIFIALSYKPIMFVLFIVACIASATVYLEKEDK